MTEAIYALCAATSALCAILLVRGYRRSRSPLLLWSSLCFLGLLAANVLLLVDYLIGPEVDLSVIRSAISIASLSALLGGLIWEAKS